jgi:hypothetical protein
MSSIEHKDLFEKYYQSKYDFNTQSLSVNEIREIKKLVREKRVDYNLAPLGVRVFDWILKEDNNLRFESVAFDSERIDGMLYIPSTGKSKAYIILNSNKPLINQIFTAAHEYYHYIKDYKKFQEMPYICDFSMLKDVNEKKACRFAAELLLPEDALYREVQYYLMTMEANSINDVGFGELSALIIFLTIKYQMPLKAVIYRFQEENYLKNINDFIENYEFIKKVLKGIKIYKKQVDMLYSTENDDVSSTELGYSIYQNMERAFMTGNASKEEVLEDAQVLGLDMKIIEEFLVEEDEQEDDEDDEELFSMINAKRG